MNIFKLMAKTVTRGAFWLICSMVMFIACATSWKPAPAVLQNTRWSVAAPDEWMRLSTSAYDMLSKDGPYLQYILIQGRPLGKPFQYTQRKLEAAMLPHEAAQVIANDLSADPHLKSFKLLSSEPAWTGGYLGFKLAYTYLDQQNVRIQSIYYGVILSDLFFNIRYTAARRFYFAKDLETFEQVRQSVRLAARSESG
jgi:hypothetical protein